MWTPAGNHRYTIEPVEDPNRPQRLFDPQDGTLVEATGDTICRYPEAHIDENNEIHNTGQTGWVQQTTGWDFNDVEGFWQKMAEAADPEHPVWDGCLKHGYEEHRAEEAPKGRSRKSEPAAAPEVPEAREGDSA